jgi:hypothetical protein
LRGFPFGAVIFGNVFAPAGNRATTVREIFIIPCSHGWREKLFGRFLLRRNKSGGNIPGIGYVLSAFPEDRT